MADSTNIFMWVGIFSDTQYQQTILFTAYGMSRPHWQVSFLCVFQTRFKYFSVSSQFVKHLDDAALEQWWPFGILFIQALKRSCNKILFY